MLRARKLGVPTPVLYHVDSATSSIYMERVEGHSVKTLLKGGGDGEMSPEGGWQLGSGRALQSCLSKSWRPVGSAWCWEVRSLSSLGLGN